MQNDDLDSSLQPLVDKLRELPEGDPRAVKRVLARLRQGEGLPNARRRAMRRYFVERAGWWAAAVVLVVGTGTTLFARAASRAVADAQALDQVIAKVESRAPVPDDTGAADRIVSRRFVIESEQAREVALVGDFNQWNPERHRLHRDGRTARWYITVRLPAGLHKYAFIVNDSVWTPDPSAVRTVDRDFGVTSSLVLVQ